MQTREAEREGFEPSRAFTLRAFQARALGQTMRPLRTERVGLPCNLTPTLYKKPNQYSQTALDRQIRGVKGCIPELGRKEGEAKVTRYGNCRHLRRRSYCGPAAVLSLVESYESSSPFGMLSYVFSGLRGRVGRRGLCRFRTAFAGDAGTSFQWLRDGLSALRRGARKGRESVAFSQKVMHYWKLGS